MNLYEIHGKTQLGHAVWIFVVAGTPLAAEQTARGYEQIGNKVRGKLETILISSSPENNERVVAWDISREETMA